MTFPKILVQNLTSKQIMNKIINYLSFISVILIVLSFYLPYKFIVSIDKIDKTSHIFNSGEPPFKFGTKYYGFECEELFYSIGLIIFITLIARFAKEPFRNIALVLLTLFFYFVMLLNYIELDIWDGDLLIGFAFTIIGSTIIILKSLLYAFNQ